MLSAILISLGAIAAFTADTSEVQHIPLLQHFPLAYDADLPEDEFTVRNGLTVGSQGQMVETIVDLPPAPANQRDARRIIATVEVMPSLVEVEEGYRAGDPWPRIGSVSVLAPDASGKMQDVEIMRFITGFGGSSTYSADLTALAPLLHGRTTLRVLVDTYMSPGWEISLTLTYANESVGFRRPVLALPVFSEPEVTADQNILRSRVMIPEGLHRPRLRIISTGHATDGRGGDEFVPRTHILRIDGLEIARWKPWAEHGNSLRQLNPASGRAMIDGREIWSSDFDRSGWHPGLLVQPMIIPAGELTPGQHEIELEIQDIRPPDSGDEDQDYGYWRVSVIVVADEPWPGRAGLRRSSPNGE